MRRKTLDTLLVAGGGVLFVVLLAVGAVATWGYMYANGTVHDQLAAQKIYFPPAGSQELASPKIGPYLNKYAGQQVVNGAQAEAYANHFIAVHLQGIGGGRTYSELSALSRKNPANAALKADVTSVFMGTTLRGLLLEAYAFWMIGQVAFWVGISAWVLAFLMLVLVALGILHARRVSADATVLVGKGLTAAAA